MKTVNILLLAALAVVFLPNLAHAELDYSALKAAFTSPRAIGNCSIVLVEDGKSADEGVRGDVIGTLRVRHEINGVQLVSKFDLPKDEVPLLHTARAIAPKGRIVFRSGALALPEVAKNSLSGQNGIRLDVFTYGADEFTYLTRNILDLRVDAQGNPVALTARKQAGVFIPFTSYARIANDSREDVNCQ